MTPTLTLIGAGRVARTLARLWHDAGVFVVQEVVNRSRASAEAAVTFIGGGRGVDDIATLQAADVVMVGCADSAIAPLAQQLALAPVCRGGPVVFHLSGALASDELAPLRSVDASLASAHPLTSFGDPGALIGRFAGTPCAIEGDARAVALLSPAFERIGAQTFSLDARDKLLYHAAAVFASNYLVTLLDAACRAYTLAGLDGDRALQLLRPLVEETVANSFAHGPRAALTGPIARGDEALVRNQHRALLARTPELGQLYRALARDTARLAGREDPLAERS